MMMTLASNPGALGYILVGIPLALLAMSLGLGILLAKYGRRKWWSAVLLAPCLVSSVLLVIFAIALGDELWGPLFRGEGFGIILAFVLLAPLPVNLCFLYIWFKKPKPPSPPSDTL